MINLKRILVPTDFSTTSEAALSYGIALTRAFNAKLVLLNVPEHPGAAAEAEYPIGIYETMQNAASQRLGDLLSREEITELEARRTSCGSVIQRRRSSSARRVTRSISS